MEKNEVQKKGFFDKAMDFIEKIGNAMSFRNFGQHGLRRCASRYGQNGAGG